MATLRPTPSATRDGSDGDALDLATVQGLLTALGPSLVSDVIDTFLVEAPRLVGALRDALAGEEVGEIRDGAHSLKSSAAALGAMRVAQASASLETAAGVQDLAAVTKLVAAVEVEHEAATLALHELVDALRAADQG